MCHSPATEDPLRLLRLPFALLLGLSQLSDRSLRRLEDLSQQLTEPVGLLLLEPPADQVRSAARN
jgi:hypothetical protein